MPTIYKHLYFIPLLSFCLTCFILSEKIPTLPEKLIFGFMFLILFVYLATSCFVLQFYKKQQHVNKGIAKPTTVDIFLPICGEDIEVLERTWQAVKTMLESTQDSIKATAYVLDDTKDPTVSVWQLSNRYGLKYMRRPNVGEMKKAGNLKHAFEQTNGEYVVIFDADFAPEPEFLDVTIPYIQSKPNCGILQTPQAFVFENINSLEYGASSYQDFFYHVIQTAREHLGGTICVGSNAVYRRSALEEIGGTAQKEASEDVWTGFKLRALGYDINYLQQPLAFGRSPDGFKAFLKQQIRWCHGSMSLLTTKEFWLSKVPWYSKLCYSTGFLFYLTTPLYLLLPLLNLYYLKSINLEASTAGAFGCFTLSAVCVYARFIQPRLRFGTYLITIANQFIYSFAVISYFLGLKSEWVPTGSVQKKNKELERFKILFGLYCLVYFFLVGFKLFEVAEQPIAMFWVMLQTCVLGALGYFALKA